MVNSTKIFHYLATFLGAGLVLLPMGEWKSICNFAGGQADLSETGLGFSGV